MALIEAVTDQAEIRRHLARPELCRRDRLGLACQPAVFAPAREPDDSPSADPPPRPGRGPPSPVPPKVLSEAEGSDGPPPALPDDFAGSPWHEDCQVSLYDDASQVPPDAQD